MDWDIIKDDLSQELGRCPSDNEIEVEYAGRCACIEAMCDDLDRYFNHNEIYAKENEYENQ